MRLRSLLLISLAAAVSACAPSADLRVPNPDGSIEPGRLVIVPVLAASDSVAVTDWSYESAGFTGAADHDPAFWAALTSAVQAELEWSDVTLHAAVSDTGFADLRVRRQGKRDLWVVRTLAVPTSFNYAAYEADHILFVRNAAVDTETSGKNALDPTGGFRSSTGPWLEVSADMVWMDATRDAPLVAEGFLGIASRRGGGLLNEGTFTRDAWSEAVEGMAQLVARRAAGRSPGGKFRLF